MRLAFAEVYETATFYAHFDVVKEDDRCSGAAGGPRLRQRDLCDVRRRAPAARTEDVACDARGPGRSRGSCARHASGCAIRRRLSKSDTISSINADRDAVGAAVAHDDSHPHIPTDTIDYDAYVAAGGYQLLAKVRSGEISADTVLSTLDDSGLRGLGGAGFPTGRKLRSVLGEPGPRLMAVNGDEGEPGTFKDRHYLNTDPHRFLEGMLIARAYRRSAGDLHLYPRRVSGGARDPGARVAQTAAGRPRRASASWRRRLYLR